ncbi:MAG: hypothetical protein IT430_01880 [Phycisphaerales bacterium]|nr:hypothetical protein [Phycisphaerales bacterium]
MEVWILPATTTALEQMLRHAKVVDLCNTDESTYRSFFMAALKSRLPKARLETEWRRFDLLVQNDGRNTLIEFKYYILRRCWGLDGKALQWKGGAGVQNEREFWDCVQKLHRCAHAPLHDKYLVLVYEQIKDGCKRKTYGASYGALGASDLIDGVKSFERDSLICKVLKIR